jgi:hypothetical protein
LPVGPEACCFGVLFVTGVVPLLRFILPCVNMCYAILVCVVTILNYLIICLSKKFFVDFLYYDFEIFGKEFFLK